MITNGTPVSTTVMIGPMSPKPNARLQNSAHARFGIARMATTQSLKNALTALDRPIAMPMTVPMTNAMTMPIAKRCNEIAKVSYRLCGATVSRVISFHMNSITCHGVGSTSTANGQMLVTSLIASSQNTRQTTGNSNRPASGPRRNERHTRCGLIVEALMTSAPHARRRTAVPATRARSCRGTARAHRTPGSRSGTHRAGKVVWLFASRSRCPWMRRTPRSAP